MDKITGKLLRVLAVGAESTGWVVKFDGGQKVGGATLKQIEVDPRPNKIQLGALRNKRVEVTGTLTSHRGIERGERRVLVIEAIRVVNAP